MNSSTFFCSRQRRGYNYEINSLTYFAVSICQLYKSQVHKQRERASEASVNQPKIRLLICSIYRRIIRRMLAFFVTPNSALYFWPSCFFTNVAKVREPLCFACSLYPPQALSKLIGMGLIFACSQTFLFKFYVYLLLGIVIDTKLLREYHLENIYSNIHCDNIF